MFKKPRDPVCLSERKATGDLTIINAGFVLDLQARGYSQATIRLYRQAVEDCRNWLKARGMKLGAFGECALARFVRTYSARCRRLHWAAYHIMVCRRALQGWLLFLRKQGWTPPEYRRFLASFDRTTALGFRNYALALCLGELGLRAGEAAALQLEDLDWRRGVPKSPHDRGLPRHLPPFIAFSPTTISNPA